MKSTAMSAHTVDGTWSSCSSPAGCSCSILFLWQVRQDHTHSRTTAHANMKVLAKPV
jgi:hypothetical protein